MTIEAAKARADELGARLGTLLDPGAPPTELSPRQVAQLWFEHLNLALAIAGGRGDIAREALETARQSINAAQLLGLDAAELLAELATQQEIAADEIANGNTGEARRRLKAQAVEIRKFIAGRRRN
jgi:hypothetical protein